MSLQKKLTVANLNKLCDMLIEHQQQRCNKKKKKKVIQVNLKQFGLNTIEIIQTFRPSSLIQRVSGWNFFKK